MTVKVGMVFSHLDVNKAFIIARQLEPQHLVSAIVLCNLSILKEHFRGDRCGPLYAEIASGVLYFCFDVNLNILDFLSLLFFKLSQRRRNVRSPGLRA